MLEPQILGDPGECPLAGLAGGSEDWLRYYIFRRPMNVISLFFIVLIFLVVQPAVQRRMTDMGLPVTVGLPLEIYSLMDLYPQPMMGRPTVQYIPMPYQSSPALPVSKGR